MIFSISGNNGEMVSMIFFEGMCPPSQSWSLDLSILMASSQVI